VIRPEIFIAQFNQVFGRTQINNWLIFALNLLYLPIFILGGMKMYIHDDQFCAQILRQADA
jgi:hypothetical protein